MGIHKQNKKKNKEKEKEKEKDKHELVKPVNTMPKSKTEILRKKVITISKMMKMFKTLREEHQMIVDLKGVTPGHRIPQGCLLEGKDGLKNALESFTTAVNWDRE